jgi:hypothetical protein
MAYIPRNVPQDPAQLPGFFMAELENIARSINTPIQRLEPLYVAPTRPRDGDLVLADGTSWNPGSGGGVYCYRAGSWRFLG